MQNSKVGTWQCPRRFDCPALLVPRKPARQSAAISNLYGVALNGRSKTALNSAVVRSCHSRPTPFRCRFQNARSVLRQSCFQDPFAVSVSSVKTVSLNEVKRQEAQSRMAAMRRARRSPAAAAAQQRRASLVGDGAKWRITNFKQVARAMSKWA